MKVFILAILLVSLAFVCAEEDKSEKKFGEEGREGTGEVETCQRAGEGEQCDHESIDPCKHCDEGLKCDLLGECSPEERATGEPDVGSGSGDIMNV